MFVKHWMAERAVIFQLIGDFLYSQETPRQMEGIYQSIPNITKMIRNSKKVPVPY